MTEQMTKVGMSTDIFRFFCEFVHEGSGISIGEDKRYLLEDRLGKLAQSLGCGTPDALYRQVRDSLTEDLKRKIIDSLTTNETLFFRDASPFEFLAEKVLPILREARKESRKLRIWSAACSSGQEIYSLLITLAEHAPDLMNWDLEILATDISDKALSRARQGTYTHLEIQRGMPMNHLIRYFKQKGNKWEFDEKLRSRVNFRRMNLTDSFAGLGKFDIIFSRYVLIYFDVETKSGIFDKFIDVINPDGYLFLGASEGIYGVTTQFQRQVDGKCVYYTPA